MPFSKMSEALAILQNTELCSPDIQAIIEKLKKREIDAANACFQIFEFDIGSESHATYAICYLAILQNHSTSVVEVMKQLEILLDLHHQSIVKQRPDREKDEVTIQDVAQRIQQLITRGLLRVDQYERIFLPR